MTKMKTVLILTGLFISILAFSEINYKYNEKNYTSSEEFFNEFFGIKNDLPEVNWSKSYNLSLPSGSSVYLLSDENVVFTGWFNNDNYDYEVKSNDGKIYKTRGKNLGYYVETVSGKIHTFYTHLNPDSGVAKGLVKVFDLAKSASINSIALPKNTKVGEVGLTGNPDYSGILILQYELKKD
jgi:hypothetical protein